MCLAEIPQIGIGGMAGFHTDIKNMEALQNLIGGRGLSQYMGEHGEA